MDLTRTWKKLQKAELQLFVLNYNISPPSKTNRTENKDPVSAGCWAPKELTERDEKPTGIGNKQPQRLQWMYQRKNAPCKKPQSEDEMRNENGQKT